ncbi:MAG: hypothetical protein ACK5RL_02960 [Acidimicrobiales bacterium]
MMEIRQATGDDLPVYELIQKTEWGPDMGASLGQLQHRHDVFPEGIVVVTHDGEPVGFSTAILLDAYDPAHGRSWREITANGWCSTHRPDGDTLFGVDLTVSRFAPRSTATMVLKGLMALTMDFDVATFNWGGRMPRYHKYADTMTAEDYVAARRPNGRRLDPEIEFYATIPCTDVLGPIPDYFEDPNSLDHGVALRWNNPVHGVAELHPFVHLIPNLLYHQPVPGSIGEAA